MQKWTRLLLVALTFMACVGDDTTQPRVFGVNTPTLGISDGASGGNPDFFFTTPLTANPSGNPNLDPGADNKALAPYVTICELSDPFGSPACVADVTPANFPNGIALKLSGDSYQENWKTSDSRLNSNRFYRIEVFAVPVADRMAVDANFVANYRYGYRDVDPDNGPNTSACTTEAYCKINNGSNLPIKVRIELFASCPVTRTCVSQFVATNRASSLRQPNGNQLTIPGQSSDFFLNFDACTAAEEAAVDGAIDLPTFGPCFKTTTPFTGTLSAPATISICQAIDFIPPAYAAQKDQITLYHFDTQNGTTANPIRYVEALPEANDCTTSVGSANDGRFRVLARAVGNALTSLINPRALHATTVALDVGGGGKTRTFTSLFKLALDGKFEYVNVTDALRTVPTSSVVTLQAKVTDLTGAPVYNARVRWSIPSSPGSGASLNAPVIVNTDANGIAQVVLNASSQPGVNLVHASGKGIADDRSAGCTRVNDPDTSCNGPRTAAPYGPFDPFLPLNHHLDGTLGTTSAQLAAGTRLEFTVIGCDPGQGTPVALNGILSAGEWDCAQSMQFPVNLSGGSATATLFWMNDANNIYFAVRVPGTGFTNSVRLDWDNNGNAAGPLTESPREVGDDIWEFTPGSGTADRYADAQCAGSSQAGCGTADGGNKNQTVAGFRNDLSGVTVYELSHPLNTGDTQSNSNPLKIDIAGTTVGQKLGVFLTLRQGNGAQGNTQWPGFKKYLEIRIK